jgi:hypothetical protein
MAVRAVLVAAVAGMIALAAPAIAASGSFNGTTSQGAPDYTVGFHVAGGHVKGFLIKWRGQCTSQQSIFLETSQRSHSITIHNGGWSTHWSYRAKLPYGTDMTGRYTIVEDTGHFSGDRARGTFRVNVTLYLGTSVNDRCHSGTIRWSAKRG